MKKYYAKEIAGDSFDYDLYYNDDCAEADKFWAGGNRDFCEINSGLVKDMEKSLEDYDYDCEQNEYDADNCDVPEEEYYRLANYWFPKNDGSKFTADDMRKLTDCRIEYNKGDYDYYDLMCKLLEIVYGEPFKHGTINGCCQGDWMNYICPESVSDDYIDWIESVLFATGTEYEITESPIESMDEFEDADVFCDYTNKFRTEDIKAWVAESVGCKPEEVVLVNIKSQHTYVKYDYEEV